MIKILIMLNKNFGSLFANKEKIKLVILIFGFTILNLLDLVGVSLIALIASISVRSINNTNLGDRTTKLLDLLHLSDINLKNLMIYFSLIALSCFIAKSLLSLVINVKVLGYLGKKSAELSESISKDIFSSNVGFIEHKGHGELLHLMTTGSVEVVVRVLGGVLTYISELMLVVLLFILLVLVDYKIAIPTFIILSITARMISNQINTKAQKIGHAQEKLINEGNNFILDSLKIQRTIYTSGLANVISSRIGSKRKRSGGNSASMDALPFTIKYLLEIVLIISSFVLASVQFLRFDTNHAIASLVLYMAAGFRVIPSVMRIQQSKVQVIGGVPLVHAIIELKEGVRKQNQEIKVSVSENSYESVEPIVKISNLNFKYKDSEKDVLKNVSAEFRSGELSVIVGPSGAGKSTLFDCIMGIGLASSGNIYIKGVHPFTFVNENPKKLGYVPPEVPILRTSILENLVLEEINLCPEISTLVWKVLEDVGLAEFVKSLPKNLETVIGEDGFRLSQGQNQRIGLARALLGNPEILLLDEATSALDSQTEELIQQTLFKLRDKGICIIAIAHRLSTAKIANNVIYISDGKICATGNFEEVKKKVPDFAAQCKLLNL
jgi:ABC-type multidrug transport system fused ATPase/permease subunit